jgi:hypothetical protein
MDREARPSSLRRFAPAVGALTIVLLGLYLRLDSFAASLWLDEFGTFWVVEGDLATTIRRCWEFQGQSPFYYLLPWMSIHALGESEVALRAPSLVLSGLSVAALYAGARTLAGPGAGAYAAAFGWLAETGIVAAGNARPYALLLFSVAVAAAAFLAAVRTGSRAARVVWVLGGAAVAWAHYVQYPVVVGLGAAYLVLPRLRTRYRPRSFVLDGVLQLALVALCIPQIVALWTRRGALSWIDQLNHFAFLPPLLPLVPILVLAIVRRPVRDESDRIGRASRQSLLISIGFQVVTLELAAIAGTNLLNPRYFIATLIPAALLAAASIVRFHRRDLLIGLAGFAVVTAAPLAAAKWAAGTFTGVGYEDWRGAVADLSTQIHRATDPIVLFRSGFVEEDRPPLGSAPPVTRAPLRSPGQPPFAVPVTSLTFRWGTPAQQQYFQTTIKPLIAQTPRFHVLTAAATPGPVGYADLFVRWVETTWPARFHSARIRYGGVELLEFSRREPPQASSVDE